MPTQSALKTLSTLQDESKAQFRKLTANTVSYDSTVHGLRGQEPLLLSLDAALRYAKAYRMRFGSGLSEDYFLGTHFLQWITGLRGLLNGDGAVALELGRSTDSKDNGMCEGIFWAAMHEAGFSESDL